MYYSVLFVMMIIGAALDVVGIGIVPAFVATLAVPEKLQEIEIVARLFDFLGIDSNKELVTWGSGALIVVFVLKNIYLSFLHYAQIRLTEYHKVRLSSRLFTAYMEAPYEFHLGRNSAELLRNVYTETREIFNGVFNPLLELTLGALLTTGIVILLVISTPWIALVGIGIVGLGSSLFLRIVRKRLKHFGKVAKFERRESFKAINQGISSIVDANIMNRKDYFSATYKKSYSNLAYAERLWQFLKKLSSPVLETASIIGLGVIILVLVNVMQDDVLTLIPILALLGASLVRLRASIAQIVSAISQIQFSAASIPNVIDDLELLKSRLKAVKIEKVERLPFNDDLVLNNVRYTYPEVSEPALKDISLRIPKGSSVAFVGSTGSGKTTLINLILGLFEPEQGSIEIDGADVFANLKQWRANIGYIPQTIFLLDDTIRANIAFGLKPEEVDEERVKTVVEAAQLTELLASSEKGLDTIVGERGARISGGQRQRIGLARALYNDPAVLIMDEATSALDNQTESLVMQALEGLKGERTFIMIAHRLSTVKACDKLYFLKNGKVEAEGTYNELGERNQEFREMAEIA